MTSMSSFYKPGASEGFRLGKDGSSYLQIISVLINAASVFLIALALLDHLDMVYAYSGAGLMVVSFALILKTKAFPLLVYISRIIVGGLFIVSGLIKANDPEGFSYKLHDYFAENALGLEDLDPYAIYLSILVAVGEIVLGFATVIGGKMRLTSWTLLILILFFSWLTYYTSTCIESRTTYLDIQGTIESGDNALRSGDSEKALILYNYADENLEGLAGDYQDSLKPVIDGRLKYLASGYSKDSNVDSTLSTFHAPPFWRACVDDCGCFGDALKGSVGRSLYPWESFGKDAILLYFVIMIFIYQGRIRLNNRREDIWLMFGSLVIIVFLCVVLGNWFFPLIFSVLLYALAIFIKQWKIKMDKEWLIAAAVILITIAFTLYTYTYLPIKDYRPYAVGNNLEEKMNDARPGEFDQLFVYLNMETKEKEEVTLDEFNKNWEKYSKNYVMLTRKQVVIKESIPNSITNFAPGKSYADLTEEEKNNPYIQAAYQNDEEFPLHKILYQPEYDVYDTVPMDAYDPEYYPDSVYSFVKDFRYEPKPEASVNFTQYILNQDAIILVVAKHLNDVYDGAMENVRILAEDAEKANIPVYCLTASGEKEIIRFKKKYKVDFGFLNMDDIELKIIIRSNPGVLVLLKGEVKGKWSSRSVPSFKTIQEDYLE